MITEESILADIIKDPKAEEVIRKHNLPCLSCPMAQMEIQHLKLGDVCKAYGLDLEAILKELNELK